MERAMKQAAKAKDASPHWVFTFGAGRAEGDAAQRDLLGGKGAYLAEMSRLGLRCRLGSPSRPRSAPPTTRRTRRCPRHCCRW